MGAQYSLFPPLTFAITSSLRHSNSVLGASSCRLLRTGRCAFSGIFQVFPVRNASEIFPEAQQFRTVRSDRSHCFAISATERNFILYYVDLKCPGIPDTSNFVRCLVRRRLPYQTKMSGNSFPIFVAFDCNYSPTGI